MQLIESSWAILLSPELNNATASRATLFILENVYSYNITSLPHVILEVFPLGFKRKVWQEQTSTFHVYLVVSKISFIKNLVADKFAANEFLQVTFRPKIMIICLLTVFDCFVWASNDCSACEHFNFKRGVFAPASCCLFFSSAWDCFFAFCGVHPRWQARLVIC